VTLILWQAWMKGRTSWTNWGDSLAEEVFDSLLQLPFDFIPL
jgi:hypothetical protein